MVKLVPEKGSPLTLIRAGDVDASGLVGGWQSSERMHREDADWWRSKPKGTLRIPCLLDIDEVAGPDLERRLQVLYAMGQPSDGEDPPGLRLYGDVPGPFRAPLWKLDGVTLGAALYQLDAPDRLRRVAVSLELSTLKVATGVEDVTVRRTRDQRGRRRRRTIRSRKGDTLRAIAVRHLGSSSDYKQIRAWNPKFKRTDPDAPLRVGTAITLR